jgi:glucose-6-phosphate 1-dehydrogenase
MPLSCREQCGDDMDAFMEDLQYFQGLYDDDSSYEELNKFLSEKVSKACILSFMV